MIFKTKGNNINIFFKAAKIAIFLTCLTILIIQISACISRYRSGDSKVIEKTQSIKKATFITFTICPSNIDAYKLTSIDKKAELKSAQYNWLHLRLAIT